jgi:hypothetical protein
MLSNKRPRQPVQPLERLSRGMQSLLLVGTLGVAIAILWGASYLQSDTWRSVATAISTGLIVSAAFGIAQSLITGRITNEILRTSLVSEVRNSLSSLYAAYFPTHEFPPSDTPSFAFNTLMTTDLEESNTLWYRGLHAKFCAARFSWARNTNMQAYLILPDLTNPSALNIRVEYRMAYNEKSFQEQLDTTRRSVLVGFMGLFLQRHRCGSIEVLLTDSPILDRIELFRQAAWVTLFSDMDRGLIFPRSLRFSHDSIIYRMQESDCLRVRRSPSTRRFEINRDMSAEQFAVTFKQMTGEELTQSLESELSEEFSSFRERFGKSIGVGLRAES